VEPVGEPLISEHGATIKCRECRVFIGQGHIDEVPISAGEGRGYLCGACFRAELRRRGRCPPAGDSFERGE
jgi:hypothetical protein